MVKAYTLTPAAREDLRRILEYIAADSVEASLAVHARFEKLFELLVDHPYIGHLRDDLSDRALRFFPLLSYLVIYIAESKPLQIIRILSAARDVHRILTDDIAPE